MGLVISDWYFGQGMETNSTGEKVKKERKDEISFRNYVYTEYVTLFLVFVRLPI